MRYMMMAISMFLAGCETPPPHPATAPADIPLASHPAVAARPVVNCGALEGAWEGKDPSGQYKVLRRFGEGRLVHWSQGRLGVFRVAACTAAEITLKFQGQNLTVKYELHGDELTLTQETPQGPLKMTARRLATVPACGDLFGILVAHAPGDRLTTGRRESDAAATATDLRHEIRHPRLLPREIEVLDNVVNELLDFGG